MDSFPPKPPTTDGRRSQLLHLLGVDGHPGIYVLGCFARYVTIYSQQVRALNLVDALAKSGRLHLGTDVFVIGGGIAGLTAAAAAAVKGARTVTLFEKQDDVLRLQASSSERFVHPHIYDWPEEQNSKAANLPIMNWTANTADLVVDNLKDQWKHLLGEYSSRFEHPRTRFSRIGLRSIADGRVEVQIDEETPRVADIAILAVGFGVDTTSKTKGYWVNLGLDHPDEETGAPTWLVSGAGDGALTDVARLCIRDFRHSAVIEAVGTPAREIGRRLLDLDVSEDPVLRTHEYLEAAGQLLPSLNRSPDLQRRRLGQVFLNCSEAQLFSPKASVLNRLIAAWLLKAGRFTLLPGTVDDIKKSEDRFVVVIKRETDVEERVVDHVILRHGPHASGDPVDAVPRRKQLEAEFPEIWAATASRRRLWETAPQHDWTRTPLFEPDDFKVEFKNDKEKEDYEAHLRVNFEGRIGCVVVVRHSAHVDVQNRVTGALENFARRYESFAPEGRRAVDPEPRLLRIEEIFSSTHALERAVRALCDADLAVFDITDQPAAVMFLLGIRAAARRGVTIPVSSQPNQIRSLPFNIASLNPIAVGSAGQGSVKNLQRAFEEGLSAHERQPASYLDLPVFDAVRELGQDFKQKPPSEQILVLRWFDEIYGHEFREVIEPLFDRFGERTDVMTTLDSRSPQLVEQRLYAEIRRTQLCVVDWTGWRPNVFFELGVRMAVNPVDPLHIVCEAPPKAWSERHASQGWPPREDATGVLLSKFFPVVSFNLAKTNGAKDVAAQLATFCDAPNAYRGGDLAPGAIYRIVAESADWHQEPGGQPICDMLALRARALDGPSVPEEGASSPVLHAEVFEGRARASAVEHLLAAYYYLVNRHNLEAEVEGGSISVEDSRVRDARRIAEEIRNRSLRLTDDNLRAMADRVVAQSERFHTPRENVIDTARRLKGRAIAERDTHGNLPRAHELLDEAERLLRETLTKLRESTSDAVREGSYEFEIRAQLAHICGSRGGLFRRDGKLEQAVAAYARGSAEEKLLRESSRPNSYNLTQELVISAMLAPKTVLDTPAKASAAALRTRITEALDEVKRQINSARSNDAYAAADLLTLSLLTARMPFEGPLDKFLELARTDRYALNVTTEGIETLYARLKNQGLDSLRSRMEKALERLKAAKGSS